MFCQKNPPQKQTNKTKTNTKKKTKTEQKTKTKNLLYSGDLHLARGHFVSASSMYVLFLRVLRVVCNDRHIYLL